MKKVSLESVLLFALVLPFILNYRISWLETPYWLFGLIFFLLFTYISLDILNLKENLFNSYKNIILWATVVLVIGSAFVSAIIVRHETSPIYMVHDIILQQEASIRFLLHGKNPYTTSYFGTPLQQWHYSDTEVNPALYYYVMEPFYTLSAIPFYLAMTRTVGFFDARIPLLFLFFTSLLLAWCSVEDIKKKRLFVILLAFNPAMLSYTLEGRSDIYMFAFLMASLLFLSKKRVNVSAVLMALAFAIKQSVWPIFPFYLAYIWFTTKDKKKIIRGLVWFAVVFLVITLPFFFWSPKGFIDSTIFYLSGNVPHGYPVSGYGFGMILHQAGIIKNVHDYFPFTFLQIIVCLPLLYVFLRYLKKNQNISTMIALYALFLFAFWYFSRYFNNSHLAYISIIFTVAYFIAPQKEQEVKK